MRNKLLSIIAVITAIFILAVVYRVDSFVFGDRMSWAEAQARSQLVAIHQAVQVEIKSLQRIAQTFGGDSFRKDRLNWNLMQPYYAVASIQLSPQGDAQTQTLFVKEKSVAYNWNEDFFNKALAKTDARAGQQVIVKPFVDGNKGRHVAIIVVSGGKAYAFVGAGEVFQALVDAQKGSLGSFAIVTRSGLTVSHGIPEYLGTLLSDDPVFKASRENNFSASSGVFNSQKAEVFGAFDQVPNSNLVLLASIPVKDLMKGRSALLWQFAFLGLGLMLVGVGGILVVVYPYEKSMEALQTQVSKLSQMPTPEKTKTAEVLASSKNSADKTNEKMDAYRKVASALGHEIRGPLTAILGYTQMVLARSQDVEVVSSAESIVRESRSVRSILEKLFSFAGESLAEKSEGQIDSALSRALNKLNPLIQQKGIKLVREGRSEAPLPMSLDDLTRAFENILSNAIEAMERMPKKEIKIVTSENDSQIQMKISDSGEGIDSAHLEKVFDPFFTTRSFQNHMGLGLAVVVGILKDHQADIKVESVRGQGTTFELRFVKQDAVKLPVAPKISTPLTEKLEMPSTLPPAPLAAHQEQEKEIALQTEQGIKPTDINIESLLELPPAETKKSEAKPLQSNSANTPVFTNSSSDDELSFIDGFLDDQPKKTPPPATPPPPPETVQFEAPKEVLAVNPAKKEIDPPRLSGAPKKNKLDEYNVEIRKPGKRV